MFNTTPIFFVERGKRGEALNIQRYIDKCLSKLLQFVQELHTNDYILKNPIHIYGKTFSIFTTQIILINQSIDN